MDCYECGKSFQFEKRSGYKKRRFCSHSCYGKNKSGKTYEQIMGREKASIMRTFLRQHIKSLDLRSPDPVKNLGAYARNGVTPWNKGKGISKISRVIRNCKKYLEWRSAILKRDHRTCQCCLATQQVIVDHIKPLYALVREYQIKNIQQAEKIEELWDIANGRVLCDPCHKKTDTYGYRAVKGVIN